jgi:hypothetical protein
LEDKSNMVDISIIWLLAIHTPLYENGTILKHMNILEALKETGPKMLRAQLDKESFSLVGGSAQCVNNISPVICHLNEVLRSNLRIFGQLNFQFHHRQSLVSWKKS